MQYATCLQTFKRTQKYFEYDRVDLFENLRYLAMMSSMQLNIPKCTLRDDYGKYIDGKLYCDMKFIVGTEEINIMAYIAFVAARSKYLRTLILAAQDARKQQVEKLVGSSCVEKQEPLLEVRLPNANPEAFEIILNYIYTDGMHLKESFDITIIIDVYHLACLFLMSDLQNCSKIIFETKMNQLNVLEALIYADNKKLQIIKDICIQFLNTEKSVTDVMSDHLFDLDKPLLVEVLRYKFNPCNVTEKGDCDKGDCLESDMAEFFESTGKDFYDIDLVLDGHVIKAHKSVLSARSKYFQAMFHSFMPPDNKVNISIGDIIPSVAALQYLLKYIYYGETRLEPQDALYIFQAASFYGFSNNRLQSHCEYSVKHFINCQNVVETLKASHYTKNLDIKNTALKRIAEDIAVLARSHKLSLLSRELLLEIIIFTYSGDHIN